MPRAHEQLNPNQEQIDQLKSRWDSLFENIADQNLKDKLFVEIVNRYTGPDRFYHNLEHINHFLQELEKHRDKLNNPQALQLAAIFHDAVYVPFNQDKIQSNEQQSADLAKDYLEKLDVPTDIIQETISLILATKYHQAIKDNPDSAIFMDIDMLILGAQPEAYDRYVQAVRQEYSFAPDDVFNLHRKKLLKTLLQKRIYLNQEMYDQYEEQARQNIERELKTLEQI